MDKGYKQVPSMGQQKLSRLAMTNNASGSQVKRSCYQYMNILTQTGTKRK